MLPIRILLSIAALLGSALATDISGSGVTYALANNCSQGGCRAFSFDKGYLFQINEYGDKPDGIAVFDPKGGLAYQVNVTAPEGSPANLAETAAADTDGTVLAPISYGGMGHWSGGIVVLNQDGKQVRFIDTGRFLPEAACFAPDHSIWVMGRRGDGKLVRKYSSDGKLIGSFLPRSLFPPGLPPAGSGVGWIRASHDRIGMMVYPGEGSNNPEWIELDLEGNLMGRWKLGPQFTGDPVTHNVTYSLGGVAFTSDGRLFAETETCPALYHCSDQLVLLDRDSSTWKAVSDNPLDRFHLLLAADGNDLVVWDRSQSAFTLSTFQRQ
jgi:hypothetical protein